MTTSLSAGTLETVDDEVDKGKAVSPKAEGGSADNSGEYEIETAKSSRSVCKSCNEKVEKGHVRFYFPNAVVLHFRSFL